jgi:hypothetical protein
MHSLFYHTAILLLFQPFIGLELVAPDVVPRELCYEAATAVTRIVRAYAGLYTLRRAPSFVPHFVLISAITHLITAKYDSENTHAREQLLQGISDLKEMSKCHGLALRAIDTLRYLAHRWGINLPLGPKSNRDSTGLYHLASVFPRRFCADASILEMLRNIGPPSPSLDCPLFLPFPMPGLPLVGIGANLKDSGFTWRD